MPVVGFMYEFKWKQVVTNVCTCKSNIDFFLALKSATGARTGKTRCTRTLTNHAKPVVTETLLKCNFSVRVRFCKEILSIVHTRNLRPSKI